MRNKGTDQLRYKTATLFALYRYLIEMHICNVGPMAYVTRIKLSPVKTIIGVPGKVVYLHYTIVYCACLSVVLVQPFVSVET